MMLKMKYYSFGSKSVLGEWKPTKQNESENWQYPRPRDCTLGPCGPTLETLDFTIHIGSTPTLILYFDLHLNIAYAGPTSFTYRAAWCSPKLHSDNDMVYFSTIYKFGQWNQTKQFILWHPIYYMYRERRFCSYRI